MTITDAQIEAAAKAIQAAFERGGSEAYVLARAALAAAQAAGENDARPVRVNMAGDAGITTSMVGNEQHASVAEWMLARSYATGHGDTIADMLNELDWQAQERGYAKGLETASHHLQDNIELGRREGFAAGIEAAAEAANENFDWGYEQSCEKILSAIRALRPPAPQADGELRQAVNDALEMLADTDLMAEDRAANAQMVLTMALRPPAAQAGGEQSPTVKQAMRVFEAALKGRRVGNAEGFAAGIEAAAQACMDHEQSADNDGRPEVGHRLSLLLIAIRALRPDAAPAGTQPSEAFTGDELNRLRQWYNALNDHDPKYLERGDRDLAKKIVKILT